MSSTYERIKPFIADDFPTPENSVLTQDEWDVYSLLSAAHNAFVSLPVLFSGDVGEFAFGVNNLKNILMSRAAERELKAMYDAIEKPVDNIRAATDHGSP